MENNSGHRGQHASSALTHFGFGFLFVLAGALLTLWLHDSMLRDLQMANLDVLFKSRVENRDDRSIPVIVEITDDDYDTLFEGESPLHAAMVIRLIQAAVLSGARVIGVDLDTDKWSAAQRQAVTTVSSGAWPKPSPPIVWAQGARIVDQDGKHKLITKSLVGLPLENQCEAIPASLPDRFGVIRGDLPRVEVEQNGTVRQKPGMALAVALVASIEQPFEVCSRLDKEAANLTQERLIDYSQWNQPPIHLTAGSLLMAFDAASKELSDNRSATPAWFAGNPLKGKIVLIGGTYSAARDQYLTPAGPRPGVDILATAVATGERGIEPIGNWPSFFIDLLLGMSLVTVTWWLDHGRALVLSFIVVPISAILVSIFVFELGGLFFSFVPVVAGVLFHHLLEHLHRHRDLKKENQLLRARNKVQDPS